MTVRSVVGLVTAQDVTDDEGAVVHCRADPGKRAEVAVVIGNLARPPFRWPLCFSTAYKLPAQSGK